VETRTDQQMATVLASLGDDFEETVGLLAGWSRIVQDARGYPQSGPHELAEAARKR
jgi:hypothetical protein